MTLHLISLEQLSIFLKENYDAVFLVGVATLAILVFCVLSQLRNGTILEFSLAVNKYKFLTAFGKVALFLAYLVFLVMLVSLYVGLFM